MPIPVAESAAFPEIVRLLKAAKGVANEYEAEVAGLPVLAHFDIAYPRSRTATEQSL